MATHIVQISDAGIGAHRVPIVVDGHTTLSHAVMEALEKFESEHRGEVTFPLFLDIHAVAEYGAVDWMY